MTVFLVRSLPGQYNQDEVHLTHSHQEKSWTHSWDYPDESLVSVLWNQSKNTLYLQLMAFVVVLVGAASLSLLALRAKFFSLILQIFLEVGGATPALLIVPLLIYIFSLKMGWLPLRFEPTVLGWILPLLALVFRPLCLATQILLDAWKKTEFQNYFLVARSKGLSQMQVYIRHGLKNALVPFTSQMGTFLVQSLTGSVLVETLFSFPGMGKLFVESLQHRDLPLILVLTLLYAFLMIFIQFISEIAQKKLEPRERFLLT